MVDSSVGGKTGVNLREGKNLVGAFHQPCAVLIEPALLSTLPDREFRCGLGEVVKYALLGDDVLASELEAHADALLARDPDVLATVIGRCVSAKAAVVAADEEERTGVRAALNLGHTAGHAIEHVTQYDLAHGEAVAIGLVFAMHLAAALERIPNAEVDRAEALVRAMGLRRESPPGLHADELVAVMARDKKSSGALTFVLPGPNGIERVDDPDRAAIDKAFAAIGVTS
jgi:3-dehydroquinate synthetase